MLRVSAETSASDVMVQGLYMRNWEEHPSLPKKEMEVKGEEQRKVERERSRGGRKDKAVETLAVKQINLG